MSTVLRIAASPIVLAARLIVFVVTLVARVVVFIATVAVPRIVRAAAYVVSRPVVLIAGLFMFLARVPAARLLRSLAFVLGWLAALLGGYLLFLADIVIYVMARVQGGGRNVRPTRRRPFAAGQKEALFRQQDGRCMYCGAARDIREFQIDHMTPVVRGGPHRMDNFQLLCGPCNNRKRDHTDDEFRRRFRELLGATGGGRGGPEPPRQQIPLDRFEEAARGSEVPQSLQDFRGRKFSPPLRKVAIGCLALGLLSLAGWAGLTWMDSGLPSLEAAREDWTTLGAGVAGYAAASLLLMWRAYAIGRAERER